MQIHILNDKLQIQISWILTDLDVCKGSAYPGSAGSGLVIIHELTNLVFITGKSIAIGAPVSMCRCIRNIAVTILLGGAASKYICLKINRRKCILHLKNLLTDSADKKLVIFFLFYKKTGLDISCKLSPMETICMKC